MRHHHPASRCQRKKNFGEKLSQLCCAGRSAAGQMSFLLVQSRNQPESANANVVGDTRLHVSAIRETFLHTPLAFPRFLIRVEQPE